MDRRIQKSKQAIMDAFIKLVTEMEFENITINKIADMANVNRGTVYLHFVDKYDLLDQCIESQIEQLLLKCAAEHHTDFTSKSALLRAFEYLEQNAFFYSTMLNNRGIPAFRNRLLIITQQNVRKQLDLMPIETNINKEITAQFLASAVVSSLEWWLANSMPYPSSLMADQIWLLLTQFMINLPKAN